MSTTTEEASLKDKQKTIEYSCIHIASLHTLTGRDEQEEDHCRVHCKMIEVHQRDPLQEMSSPIKREKSNKGIKIKSKSTEEIQYG